MSAKCFLLLMTVIIAIYEVTSQDEPSTKPPFLEDLANKLGIPTANPKENDIYTVVTPTKDKYLTDEEFCNRLEVDMKEWDTKSEGIGKSLACMKFSIASTYGQEVVCALTKKQRAILEKAVEECPMQSEIFKSILENSIAASGHVCEAYFPMVLLMVMMLLFYTNLH